MKAAERITCCNWKIRNTLNKRRLILLTLIMLLLSAGNAAAQENENRLGQEIAVSIQIETLKTDSFSMDYFRSFLMQQISD